jgi:hypothetical protein
VAQRLQQRRQDGGGARAELRGWLRGVLLQGVIIFGEEKQEEDEEERRYKQ